MAKQRFFRGMYNRIFVLIVTFLLGSNCLFAEEQADTSERPGYDIFLLKHISVEQGKKYLAELGIGTVSHFPGSSTLLVTALPRELIKAKAILNLVDGQEKFTVEEILLASSGGNMPSNEQVAAKLGNISIGSFSNPPTSQNSARAIIDIHNDAVVVVAPVNKLEKILSTIERLQEPNNNQVQSVLKAQDKLEAPDRNKTFNLSRSKGPEPHFATSKTGTQPNIVAAMLEQKAAETIIPKQNALAETALNQRITDQTAVIQSQELESIPNAEEVLKLDLPEKITIVDLLGLAGEYLQLDFLYEPSDVVGEVTLKLHGKLRGPMKVKNLYPLLESVLKFKGFVMTRKGNLVLVAPKGQALDIDPALIEPKKGQIERGDVVVTRLFELEHISTATATKFLEDMKLSLAISSISETGTLIVTGYAYRMERIERLLEMVDKPGKPKKFKFRQLQYTMAQTLAPKLQTLSEQLGTVSITIAAPSPAPAPVSPRRSNETQAQYDLRVRRAAEAARRTAAQRAVTRAAEPVKPTVYIDADERTNRIMMIGLDEQLDVVDELIDTLDVVQQDLRTLQPYKIEHVDAVEVKRKLEELNIISPSPTTPYSSRITNGTKQPTQQLPTTGTQAARAQAARTVLAKAQMEDIETGSLVEEPQVVVIEPTNSLLVNATEEQHTRIASIISYVDSQILEDEIPYKIYPLENSSPEHMAGLLERLIQETVVDKEGKIQEVITRQEEPPIIVPDPNTFSLIVYATKKDQEWISSLIETLDKRRPQVLIDVTLVVVEKVNDFELDLDIVSRYGGFPGGGEMELVDALLSPFPEKQVLEGGSFSGAGTGFYGDRHIQALLRAVQSKSYGRVLAKPKILVNDGQPGTIRTTTKTNVRTEQVIVPDQGTQRTATSFLEFEAGIELVITPNISEGDLLLLKVNMTRSDFSEKPPSEGTPPDKNESVVDTTVTVPDGKTIILGGLIKLKQNKAGSKIPILGDIPILGGLFRSTINTDEGSNLYIFVKANILRPDETLEGLPDLEKISERNRIAFERLEDQFQRHEDWPGIEPKPMEPPRVLETE